MFSEIAKSIAALLAKFPAYRLTSVLIGIMTTLAAGALLSDRLEAGEFSSLTAGQTIPISIFVLMTVAVGFAAVLTLFTDKSRASEDIERELAAALSSGESQSVITSRPSTTNYKSQDMKKVYEKSVGVGYISTIFSRSRINLKTELRKTRSAAGQSLSFGIFFCFVAIGCTIYFIYTGSSAVSASETSLYPFLIYYLPRLSVAVVAQVVALFFLNLSIINQRDSRAIRNEVTNLDMREAGVVLALLHDDQATSALVADQLIKTERNFLLRRGERVMHEGDQYEKLSEQAAGIAKVAEALKPAK